MARKKTEITTPWDKPASQDPGLGAHSTGAGRAASAVAAVVDAATRQRARDLASSVGKHFSAGSVMLLDGSTEDLAIERLSWGHRSLDMACGGGIPKGRIIEIFGLESSGKTTLVLNAIAAVQRAGGVAALVDAEHAFDPAYAAQQGVAPESLLISQPDTGEEALEIVEALVDGGADLVAIDSVAALVPKAEIEGEMGDAHMGLQARLMGQAMRKLTGKVAQHKTIVIFINQIRQKMGVFFGPNTTTPGGNALKFYSSIRLEVSKIGVVREGGTSEGEGEDDKKAPVIGIKVRIKVVKNKTAPPFRQAEVELSQAWGLDPVPDTLDLAVAQGVVERSGAWYAFAEQRLGCGRAKAIDALRDNPGLVADITGKLT